MQHAIRHGGCNSLEVSLDMSPGRTILEIADDGRGLGRPEERDKDWQPDWVSRTLLNWLAQFDGELEIKTVLAEAHW
jgi:hypothetical protein